MRRSISKIPYRSPTTPSSFTAAFSTGGGRGRGAPTHFHFTADDETQNSNHPQGHGRGRGVSVPSSSVLPSFSSYLNNESSSAAFGRGRARGSVPPNSTSPLGEDPQKPNVKKPFFNFVKDEETQFGAAESEAPPGEKKSLPAGIFDVLVGAGRGKPGQSTAPQSEKPKADTQQTRARDQSRSTKAVISDVATEGKDIPREQLSREEKVRKAVNILSRGDGGGGRGGRGDTGVRAESGERGRGRGTGRGRGRGRGGYGGRGNQDDRYEEPGDQPTGQYFGDPADEEKVAKKLGPENMGKVAEGFEEMSGRVLPSPMDDAFIDAYETNLMIECEPEYFMEEFGTNPDIDEKPPIPLRDALEKMKPFLMAYEGIQSQEEWEEIIEETMKKVPLMKEIVDHYGGRDRVTAKQQKEELERVAETLPASAPASVKRFTDRAVLSLQSNPGWGFDKKCQFMDKLIMEVSQQYK
ncbi:hydroxyproline-rich glycoprotein family protein [Perilla frutescens var. hirtella]|nr:hydroxyproline-rich glycoprotein family protein [Perilla frutescens var. frutescens]KAH6775867.1 hydroxyproline-rich glycoprotein family protein [Perilla frutescens var. hirtella]